MARLPTPGSDDGTWGNILNDFLSVEHNADGTLKIRTDTALTGKADDTTVVHVSGAETIAGTKTFSASPVVPTPTLATQAANKSYVDSTAGNAVQTVNTKTPTSGNVNIGVADLTDVSGASGATNTQVLAYNSSTSKWVPSTVSSTTVSDATTGAKGIVQLAGDLAGTAALPTVAKVNGVAVTGSPSTGQVLTAGSSSTASWASPSATSSTLTPTAVKTSAYTAAAGDLIPVDTTSGSIIITLPATPTNKSQIAIKHVIQGGTNTVTVMAGGSDVFNKTSGSSSLTLSTLNQALLLQYNSATAIWYVLEDSLALSQLDARYLTVRSTGQQSGIASLNDFGRIPAQQTPTAVQNGIFFNSYTLGASGATTTGSLATIESDLNATFDYVIIFQGVSPGGTYTQWSGVQTFLDAGRKVVLNIQLSGTIAQINGGSFDTALNQLGAAILGYAAANPGWKDKLIVKTMHEVNVSTTYAWCAYTAQNISDAGSQAASISASVTAYQHISTTLRAAATINSICYVKMVFEIGSSNYNNDVTPFDNFYPGDAYVDIVSVNIYNRYAVSSGVFYWSSFATVCQPVLEAFRRFAPNKPIMIGETSSTPGGQVNSISVTAGGSGYGAGTTVTIGGAGSGATATPTISGGVINSVTVTASGQDYNDTSFITLGNTGGGSGATLQVNLIGDKFDKAQWFYDAQTWVRDQSDILWITWFFTNVNGGAGDLRYWAPNTAREKQFWTRGYGSLNGRSKGQTQKTRIGINLADDPYANDVSKWTVAGSNAGTLTRTVATQNNPGFDSAIFENTGVIRITHNGTAGAPQDNRVYSIVPQGLTAVNQNFTLSFDARFKPSGTTGTPYVVAGLETNDVSANLRKLLPPIVLYPQWRRYTVSTYTTTSSSGYRISFAIGQSSAAGQFLVSNIKLEYGDTATPLLPPQRQLTRTTVQDAAYSFVNGTTDELLAYTSLTAGRIITLPDATLTPRGRLINIKDEAGTAGTNNLTVATTASQTIDGASTKIINSNYGSLRLYSNGSHWFTL